MGEQSSDSWDAASLVEFEPAPPKQQKVRESAKHVKMKMLHQFLLVVQKLRQPRSYRLSKEINAYEIAREIFAQGGELEIKPFGGFYRSAKSADNSPELHDPDGPEIDAAIEQFVSLNMSGIEARVYFALGQNVSAFVEYNVGPKIVEHTKKYSGNVFGCDRHGQLSDQTVVFTKTTRYHRIFRHILGVVGARLVESQNKGSADSQQLPFLPLKHELFGQLDSQRMGAIPATIAKLKIHPLYTVESLCRKSEIVYPKGVPKGTFKDEKVYLRSRVQRLKTEKGWFREGRTLKAVPDAQSCAHPPGAAGQRARPKPYRIVDGVHMYARFQTEAVRIADICGREMLALHENFTPQSCVYIDADPEICALLDIPHAVCVVGFRPGEKVYRGFYVHRKDCMLVHDAILQRAHFKRISDYVSAYENTLRDWKQLLKRMSLYLKVKAHVGD
ncbi:hypothetical protein PAPHI01_1162 [Pancytospora philotis]|nr:hypothetical protein PAPHI01_1162 [Pancytospora philotis]